MEKFTSSSAKEKEIVCYGVAWTKAESLKTEEDTCEGKKLQNTVHEVELESTSLPKRNSLDVKDLSIEIVSNSQRMATGRDDVESQKSPGKLKPIHITEVERLEMQKEALENKVQELREKHEKEKNNKKNKESYLLQIKNTEKKIEMLEKRIAYEKRTNLPLQRWRSVKTLSKASKSFHANNIRSDKILAKKMKAKLVLKEGKGDEGLRKETLDKKEKNANKWKSRWKEVVLEEDSDDEMEIYGIVIKKPKRTTVFCPPIPDPMAKKRPKDSMPSKERGPAKQGEPDEYRNNSDRRLRLVPNRRRVLLNRAKVYEKQLEFAKKYGLNAEDIVDNLKGCQQELSDGQLAPSVTKQQLHLIGALSEDYILP